jgi:hypothetical protein
MEREPVPNDRRHFTGSQPRLAGDGFHKQPNEVQTI